MLKNVRRNIKVHLNQTETAERGTWIFFLCCFSLATEKMPTVARVQPFRARYERALQSAAWGSF